MHYWIGLVDKAINLSTIMLEEARCTAKSNDYDAFYNLNSWHWSFTVFKGLIISIIPDLCSEIKYGKYWENCSQNHM